MCEENESVVQLSVALGRATACNVELRAYIEAAAGASRTNLREANATRDELLRQVSRLTESIVEKDRLLELRKGGILGLKAEIGKAVWREESMKMQIAEKKEDGTYVDEVAAIVEKRFPTLKKRRAGWRSTLIRFLKGKE